MPGAGDLKHRIAFDSRTVVDDGYGNEVAGDFAEQFVVAAALKPLRGGEAVLAARLGGTQPVVITVRKSSQTQTITPAWRARDVRTGEVYAITAPPIDTEQKGAFLDILATAGVAA